MGKCKECGKIGRTKRLDRRLYFVDREPGGGVSAWGKYCPNCLDKLLKVENRAHEEYVHRGGATNGYMYPCV